MKNSQLIKLLKTFTSKEIIQFGEFISSPYFNKKKNIIKLYKEIKKAYPKFEQGNLTKEKLFSSIYPGRKYNDSTLRLLIHLLYEKARRFLAQSRFDKEIYENKADLINELYDRKLFKESIKEIEKAISELDKTEIKDSNYFRYKHIFENYKLYCLRRMKQDKFDKFIDESSMETPFKYLTYYYFSKLLVFYNIALNTKNLVNIDIKTDLFEKILSYFEYELFDDSPFIQIHYNLVMINKTNDEKYFYIAKNILQKNERFLPPLPLYSVYVSLENFCSRKIMAGEKHFLREFFDILKLHLENKIYRAEPSMSRGFFQNILRTATKLKEFNWADNFIETYKNELHTEIREVVSCYCRAYLEAEKNNFEKSLEYLSTLKTDELFLKIDSKVLQARIYYELDWYDILNSALDSIRYFLKTEKFIPKKRKLTCSNFTKFLRSLNNARLKKDEMKIIKLRDEIKKTEALECKDWLIKKVEELEAA